MLSFMRRLAQFLSVGDSQPLFQISPVALIAESALLIGTRFGIGGPNSRAVFGSLRNTWASLS